MNSEAEQQLLHHARNGNVEEVRQLLETMERNEVIADINCKGKLWVDFLAFSCDYAWLCHLFSTDLFGLARNKFASFILERTFIRVCKRSLVVLSQKSRSSLKV